MATDDTITQKVSLELIGTRLLEAQAEQRGIRMEMRLIRTHITQLEGRLIDAFNERLGAFEVRIEDQLGRLLAEFRARG